MQKLSAALGWSGLALILAPIALLCLIGIVIVAIASPVAAVIFAVIVVGVVEAVRAKPAETKPRSREQIERDVRRQEAARRRES